MRRLLNATVWGRNAFPPTEARYKGILQRVLPATDLSVAFWSAVFYLFSGMPEMSHTAGHGYAKWWVGALAIAATCALIGLAFVRLWPLELAGRLVYSALLAGYLALSVPPALSNILVLASLILSLTLLYLNIWRIGDLGYVWWTRKHRKR